MRKIKLFIFAFLLFIGSLSAKEGMWIPLLLEKYTLSEMQEMGFQLSAEDIYTTDGTASMKDAVVIFGGGCTGELISGEGLLITNHHCGYSEIQSHSTMENDYLTNGFWAGSREEELPNPGLSVRFLEYMEDVTSQVLEGTNNLSAEEKERKIQSNILCVAKEASDGEKYMVEVKPLFYGNQYYVYVYKVYRDVRLVGAPPSAIGKFGGDTDNWMWPRHTGDFSLFRIYADENNEPADYSPDNVPFKPKKFFSISLNGVQPEDFTMVLGNPGRTMEYIPSHEVDIILNQRDPDRIAIRDKKLEIISAAMESDPEIRIQYSAKHASISNAWKKWQGEILGLQRLDAVNKKLDFEKDFRNWAETEGVWESEYKKVFANFDTLYFIYQDFIKASDYYSEIVLRGIELFQVAASVDNMVRNLENNQDIKWESQLKSAEEYLSSFFKDYNRATDEKLFTELLPMLASDLKPEFLPVYLIELLSKHQGEDLVKKVYGKSVLHNWPEMKELLAEGNKQQLLKLRQDPIVELYNRLNFHFETTINPVVNVVSKRIDQNMESYMAGIMKMKAGEPLYPDANLTLRVAYGKVEGYNPQDGVKYKHYTTLKGVMEKDNPEIYDYDVPVRLRELYDTKDFGRYAANGDLPVCFTASNHTTGGNSGSPVINAEGHLVGVNFDRCWEGTMSDIMYDPEMCRNIAVDIRYVLFLIDKFAGAGYLLEEMELVGGGEKVRGTTSIDAKNQGG
ncbi:S46 family peptidase [Mariniphaga sediminis]|uniref:Dipeptidyl-peptidase n=1 Tax=Mariniphaga sediminis TaxID=1628158 RepID=A0A399D5T7_9BACT|nr:S46 family peptidase [Mariniphaga sediminis]RIH67254.1 S46 family peptidase [Mariniphaga sediminis]